MFLLLDVLRSSGQRAHLVLAFAWNPLLAIEVAGSGHIDIVGALLLVVSAAALASAMAGDCGRRTWAGDSSEISANRIVAPLLEAGSHSRRCAGGSRRRTPVRAVS